MCYKDDFLIKLNRNLYKLFPALPFSGNLLVNLGQITMMISLRMTVLRANAGTSEAKYSRRISSLAIIDRQAQSRVWRDVSVGSLSCTLFKSTEVKCQTRTYSRQYPITPTATRHDGLTRLDQLGLLTQLA